jgi:hypothetical protein
MQGNVTNNRIQSRLAGLPTRAGDSSRQRTVDAVSTMSLWQTLPEPFFSKGDSGHE